MITCVLLNQHINNILCTDQVALLSFPLNETYRNGTGIPLIGITRRLPRQVLEMIVQDTGLVAAANHAQASAKTAIIFFNSIALLSRGADVLYSRDFNEFDQISVTDAKTVAVWDSSRRDHILTG